MITRDVENYRGPRVMGPEMMAESAGQAERFGSEFIHRRRHARSTSPSARSASGSRARSIWRATVIVATARRALARVPVSSTSRDAASPLRHL